MKSFDDQPSAGERDFHFHGETVHLTDATREILVCLAQAYPSQPVPYMSMIKTLRLLHPGISLGLAKRIVEYWF